MSGADRKSFPDDEKVGKSMRAKEITAITRTMRLNRMEPPTSVFEVGDEVYKKRNAADADIIVNQIPDNDRAVCKRAQIYEYKVKKAVGTAP